MNGAKEPNWEGVEKQAVSLIDKGHFLRGLDQHEQALASFDKAVTICRDVSDAADTVALVLSQALDNKAGELMELKRLPEALACYDEAIQVHESFMRGEGTPEDVRQIGISVMNKGLALMRLERYDEALTCIERAVDDFAQCRSPEDYARALVSRGDLCFRQNRLDDALEMFNESLRGWKIVTRRDPDACNSDYAYTLYSKADALLQLGRHDESLESVDHAVTLLRRLTSRVNGRREREDLADTLKLRGEILTKLGRIKEAEGCFHEAAKLRGNERKCDRDAS